MAGSKTRARSGGDGRRSQTGLPDAPPKAPPSFPIVGIGASAGGLEAFSAVLSNISPKTGMGFVIIQHLAPQQESLLAQLLRRATEMTVIEAKDGMEVCPNRVHVIPPNVRMMVKGGVLSLEPRVHGPGLWMPIDHFFQSLASDQSTRAIGVVLSGNDSDGATGLAAIRAEGGITLVQTSASAKHSGMPNAAIASGMADLVLTPQDIGRELERIAQTLIADGTGSKNGEPAAWKRILTLLKHRHGVDFSEYKSATVSRRVNRRMVLQRKADLASYSEYVEESPAESSLLFDDLLINVTGFMRDPDVFEKLEADVVPRLLSERNGYSPIRIWAPGCATGEEIYSIGMCLLDGASRLSVSIDLNLFGTDLNEKSVAFARNATYTDAQLAHLPSARRDRYFTRVNGRFQVVKRLRQMCVFARHNLGSDAPFSRMDFISCRNVLIYMGEQLQDRVVRSFHYALRNGGYLMLGHSEGLGDGAGMFGSLDKAARLYQKKNDGGSRQVATGEAGTASASNPAAIMPARAISVPAEYVAGQIAASVYGPAWILVDESYRLLQSSGDTSEFLRVPAGRATLDVLQLAREEIRGEFRRVLGLAVATDDMVRSDTILKSATGGSLRIDVRRIREVEGKGQCFLVVFLPGQKDTVAEESSTEAPHSDELLTENQRLREELRLATERLQWIVSERDAAIHDLTCANEEIRSSNEELQSINEEIETSKEEVEAANEELNTLNEELASRNLELSRLSDDLNNVLMSAAIPILMVDNDLRIRRSTAAAEDLLNIRESDEGRSIGDIRLLLSVEDVQPLIRKVIDTLTAVELEVQDRKGSWRMLRIRPYRTADNRIEGAVLVFLDIDQLRKLQLATEQARRFAESVTESVRTPLAVLDRTWSIRLANRAFLGLYGANATDVRGQSFFSFQGSLWNSQALKTALERLISEKGVLDDFEVEAPAAKIGPRFLSVSARLVQPDADAEVLVAIEDITERKISEARMLSEQAQLQQKVNRGAKELESTARGLLRETAHRQRTETALQESESALHRNREELRALTARLFHAQDQERRRVSRELHDDLSQKVAKLQFDIERLQQDNSSKPMAMAKRLESLREQAGKLSDDVRRIAHQLHPSSLDHLGLPIALRSYCRDFSFREGVRVRFTAVKAPKKVAADIASSLYRIVQEALRNVAKHAGKAEATITLTGGKDELRLRIRDNGGGFDPESVRGKGGLGLVSMEERVRLLNGSFRLRSLPHRGVTIEIAVPLALERKNG